MPTANHGSRRAAGLSRRSAAALLIAAGVGLTPQLAPAQQVERGVTVQRGWLNQRRAIEPLSIVNTSGDQLKNMQRVVITVFNVAFPDDFTMKSSSSGVSSTLNLISTSKSRIHTHLDGVDPATRQAIADQAYADFVTQMKAAGFDVLDPKQLAAAAPEITTWTALPNGTRGRFGSYFAPTGMALYFMPGDTDHRSTSGMFGQQMTAFRALDFTQADKRTPYVARDANATAIAVTLVVDYGVYSSSGNRRGFGKKVSTGFEEGATIAAGTVGDNATAVRVWNSHSGGFPTLLTLQKPVISEADIGPADSTIGDFVVKSSPALFAPAAIDVIERANGAIVSAFVARR